MSNLQERTITVKGGYSPATIAVAAGRPVRLTFDRQESAGCSAGVMIPAFGIARQLAAHAQTAIEFTPTGAGVYGYSCGMRMLRGTIVVEPA